MVGIFFGFFLMRNYVFFSKKNLLFKQITKFLMINILALFQTLFISIALKYLLNFFLEGIDFIELIAHIIGVSFPALTSYFAHKFFTFK